MVVIIQAHIRLPRSENHSHKNINRNQEDLRKNVYVVRQFGAITHLIELICTMNLNRVAGL